jgi:hypothetical protein
MKRSIDEINEYIQLELASELVQYIELTDLIFMPHEDKIKLIQKIKELKALNSNEAVELALEDLNIIDDFGGSAKYLLLTAIIECCKDTSTTTNSIMFDDSIAKHFEKMNKYYDGILELILKRFSVELASRILKIICEPKLTSKYLRSWKLVSTDKDGNITGEMTALDDIIFDDIFYNKLLK